MSTGQTEAIARERYTDPSIEQAQANLETDLNELKPKVENTEFVPQLLNLFETARTKTGEAARQARESLGSGIKLLKASAGAALSPLWQEQVDGAVPLLRQQVKDPENKEIAEKARMRLDTISENHSMYLDLQKTGIPKERIDAFMDKRAATEARIMDDGLAAGKSMDEIEKEQKAAREQEAKEFVTAAKQDGYEITPEVLDKFNIFIDIADHRSELHDAGAYIEASNAETYTDYTKIMDAAGLAFLIGSAALSMDSLGEAEEAPGAEAAAQAQLMRDIQDMAREDQERADEAKKIIEDLMEKAEESGEETKVADLNDEMKERLEKLGVEQDKTINEAEKRERIVPAITPGRQGKPALVKYINSC
ncbi:hypothetical protein GF415_03640 [Candidatus Micrarchaeota archaeon]|nr:hypothetical protein [Candidatus Micrarchaeota archaeon]